MPKSKTEPDELKNRVEELFSGIVTGADQAGAMDPYGESVFRTAFENSAVAMSITGTNGRFMLVNRAFASILGYLQDELEGKSFQALTYPEDTAIGGDAMRAMLSGETATALIQKRYLHKDGHAIWAELNITLVRDEQNKPLYFVTIVRDISEQKSTTVMLDKRVRELNCLNDIGHKIDEQPPLSEFLDWVAGRIPDAMLYPDECLAAIEYQGKVYGASQALDLSSKVVGGIRIAGELVGWLHIAYTQTRAFIDAESALVGGIVSRISGYLHTLHQQELAQRQASELTILNDMALALTSALDLDAIVETVYRYCARLTDVTNFFLALYDPESETVSFPIAYGDGERIQINTRPLGNALTDFIIRRGEPLLFTDNVVQRAEEKGIKLILYGKPVPAQSWLGVPINYGGGVMGVIAVQSITTPGLFKEYDREVLTNIARSAANAIALARQYQQTQSALAEVQESQRSLTDIIDFLPEAIFVIDRSSKVVAWNKAMENLTGVRAEEILGKGDYEYARPFYGEARPILIDLVTMPDNELESRYSTIQRQGDILIGETHHLEFLGRETYLAGRAASLHDSRGEIVGAIEIVQDVTERRLADDANVKRATEMAVVAQVSTAVATVLNPQELLQTVVDLTKERFNLYHAHLYMLNASSDRLVLTAGAGELGRAMLSQRWEIPLDREQSLVARAARTRKGVIVNDVRADAGFLPNEFLPKTAAELAVPLIAGDEILGVLDVQSDEVDYFTEVDITAYTTLAYQVAVALQNARLYSRAQQALSEAEALYQGSSVISAAQSIDDVLQALVESTALSKLDRVNVLFFDQPWEEIMPESLTVGAVWEKHAALSTAPAGTVYPFASFPGFQFLDRSGAVVVSDILTDERVDANLIAVFQRLGMRSVLVCPLKAGNEWFGIVSAQAGREFYLGEDEVRRINNLMDQAATVIQNLRLIERIRLRVHQEQLLREITTRVRGLMEPDVIMRTAVRELGAALGRKAYIFLGESSGKEPDENSSDLSGRKPKETGER